MRVVVLEGVRMSEGESGSGDEVDEVQFVESYLGITGRGGQQSGVELFGAAAHVLIHILGQSGHLPPRSSGHALRRGWRSRVHCGSDGDGVVYDWLKGVGVHEHVCVGVCNVDAKKTHTCRWYVCVCMCVMCVCVSVPCVYSR